MSSLIPIGLGVLGLLLGYVVYSRLVTKWMGVTEDVKVPAHEFRDGVDYEPARHWTILFGHHFASIAGAAPIVGPVIACMLWGWLPAVLWIVIGGVFFGAVHDYFALTHSVKNKGRSISDLSETVLGKVAKIAFSTFVLLTLILVVAVFAVFAGKTLAASPQVVIPTFGLIFVAMAIGYLVYHTKCPLVVSTLAGLALLLGLIVLGYYVPISLTGGDMPDGARVMFVPGENVSWLLCATTASAERAWIVILLVYGLVASVMPVTLLLQPRDHLAGGVLFFGMLFGFIGLLMTRPALRSPAFVAFSGAKTDWLWPMLFVTVACGAISGFHSLVASGTTSKQLPRMRDARPIGYGGMVLESALALLAVACVAAGLYWKTGPEGLVYQDLAKKSRILAFGVGYGQITQPIFGALGVLIGITMLKTFIMTTLDSATRITRYVTGELLGDTLGLKVFNNRYVATLFVGILAGWLALTSYGALWPIFGSANQLVAAMVLIIATVFLISRGRRWAFTAIPGFLILLTTIGALVYKFLQFLQIIKGEKSKSYLLATVAAILMVLAVFVVYRGLVTIRNLSSLKYPRGGAPVPPRGRRRQDT